MQLDIWLKEIKMDVVAAVVVAVALKNVVRKMAYNYFCMLSFFILSKSIYSIFWL